MASGFTNGWSSGSFTVRYYWTSVFNASTRKSTVTVVPQILTSFDWHGDLYGTGYALSGAGVYVNGQLVCAFDGSYISENILLCSANYNEWTNFPPRSGPIAAFSVSHDDTGAGSFSLGFYGTIIPSVDTGVKVTVGDNLPGSFRTVSLQEAARSYTVSYNKGANGTGTNTTAAKTYNTPLTLKGAIFTRAGCTQDGWSTTDGGSKTYSLSASYTANAAVTLYPHWKANTYTVSYSANGGTGAPAAQTKTHGVALTLSSTKPTKASVSAGSRSVTYKYHNGSADTSAAAARTTSYTFSGWNTASDGSGTSYAAGGSYTANAAATLYAQYTASTATSALTLPTPTRSGYSFKGWYTAESGGTKIGAGGARYTPSAAVTLHAQWTALSSTIAYCTPSVETGGTLYLTVDRKSAAYSHQATFRKDGTTLGTSPRFSTDLSYTVPKTWFNDYPNDTELDPVTVSVQTYASSASSATIGSAVTTTFLVKADASMRPSCATGWATPAPYNTGTAVEGCPLYVKGYSKAQVTFDTSKITMANNAAIASCSIKCLNVTDSASPYLTPVLNTAGAVGIVRTVTDTRGRSRSYTYNVSVTDYARPKLSGISVFRCDSGGTADEDGTYISIKATSSHTPLDGWNTCTLQAQHKATGAGSYGAAYALTSGTAAIKSGFSSTTSYHVKITATDRLGNTASCTVTIPTQKWAMKFRSDGNGVAFGKVAETSGTFEVTPDWTTRTGAVQASGNVVVTKPTGEAVLQAHQSTSGVKVTLDSTGSTNSGLYINGYYDGANFVSDPRWLIYRNGSGDTKIEGGLTVDGASVITRKLPAMAGNTDYRAVRFVDADNIGRGGLLMYRSTSASYGDGLRLQHARTLNGATTANMLTLYVNDSGSAVVTLSHPSAWRTALGVQAGNTLSFGTDSYVRWAGDWRNATNLWFTIPLNMSCAGLTAAVSGSVIVISNNTRTVVSMSSVTPTCYVSHTGVTVNMAYPSAPSYAVASGLANVQAYGLTITFS